MKESEKYELK